MRYTCVGTCVISCIVAAVMKQTCPEVRDGYKDECGNVDVLGLLTSFVVGVAVNVSGEVAMVRACISLS